MQATQTHTFKNEATRRFHDYIYGLVKLGGEDKKKVYEAFDLHESSNPSSFFAQMRNGKKGVTLEHIYTAKDKLKLNPGYLFEVNDSPEIGFTSSIVNDPEVGYGLADKSVLKQIGEKLHNIFKKHGTEIKGYAEKQLGLTRVGLHKIFRGESRPYFDMVLKVVEDHGESLEQFRTKPLPKGHHLSQMDLQGQLIQQQQARINDMEQQIKNLTTKKRT